MNAVPPVTAGKDSDTIKNPGRVLGVGLVLGWGFDALFYGKYLGVSVLLFVLGLVGALFWVGRTEGVKPAARNLWLALPMLFFAGMVTVRANGFLTVLNVSAVVMLLGLVGYFYSSGRVGRLGLIGYPLALMLTGANALFRAAPVVRVGVSSQGVRQVSFRRLLPVMRGLALALPVLSVFTCLLASADLVFARYVLGLFRLDILFNVWELSWRLVIIMVVAWLLAGGLVYALRRKHDPTGEEPWEGGIDSVPQVVSIGFVEVITLVVAVDLLFVAFGWIQIAYLFGGEANIGVEGYTYAEYARRGFFELLAVAVLTLGLILGLHWLGWREAGRQRIVFSLLSSVMVGLVMVLLASAFWRMMLYEEAYGYTHLRLYVHVFEVWLAVAFVWLVATLWLPKLRFGIGGFVAAIGFLVTLNLANPDAFIAQENLARWEVSGKLDVGYLMEMSEDAVPVLMPYVDKLQGYDGDLLREALQGRLKEMKSDGRWREWASFNLARQEAYEALVKHKN